MVALDESRIPRSAASKGQDTTGIARHHPQFAPLETLRPTLFVTRRDIHDVAVDVAYDQYRRFHINP